MILSPYRDRSVQWRAGALAAVVGLMWLSFGIDVLTPGHILGGIIPRSSAGLTGIITAPFVHGNLSHLVANTIPLIVLGALILLKGTNEFLVVMQLATLISGAGTWLFGRSGIHIGASGIVFGLFGFLLFRTVYHRTLLSILITILVAILYGSVLGMSLLPAEGVSWSGHMSGFVGGILAARFLYRKTS